MRNWMYRAALIAYSAFLLTITVTWVGSPGAEPNLVPFAMMRHDWRVGGWEFWINFVGNVAVFVPFGLVASRVFGPRVGVVGVSLLGCGLSLGIEVAQGVIGRRVADVDDVILNTLGTVLGAACAAAWGRIRTRGTC